MPSSRQMCCYWMNIDRRSNFAFHFRTRCCSHVFYTIPLFLSFFLSFSACRFSTDSQQRKQRDHRRTCELWSLLVSLHSSDCFNRASISGTSVNLTINRITLNVVEKLLTLNVFHSAKLRARVYWRRRMIVGREHQDLRLCNSVA